MAAGGFSVSSYVVAGMGLAATVVVAILTQRANLKQEQLRWAREDRTRWH